MDKIPFSPAKYNQPAFNCPHCDAYAHQQWSAIVYTDKNSRYQDLLWTEVSICEHCEKFCLWFSETMIYPDSVGAQPPNPDLDDEIKQDYREASTILQKSPRGAAALLRLVIQKLCAQLGENGRDLNIAIGNLVKKGLPQKVQQSLDAVRVIGNEAVHPGQLDLEDDVETAAQLFRLVNFIAEKMITEPKQIEDIFNKIPDPQMKQIAQRDKK